MKVSHSLICLVFLTGLQDGKQQSAQATTYTAMEGKNITVSCSFTFSGTKMYFCKTDCSSPENILVETGGYRAQKGRYTIEYNRVGPGSRFVNVSITELKMSDSGRYRCALGRAGLQHNNFQIVVNSASPAAATTTTQSLSFSPSSPSSSETTKQSKSAAPPSGVLLSVSAVLAIFAIILALALLIFFKHRRSSQHKGSAEPLAEAEYSTVVKTNRVKIRQDGSPDQTTENSSAYNLASWPQNTVEGDALNYSEVHFSKRAAISHSGAPCGHPADGVIYSEPRTNGRPANHNNEDSAPLYSTVTHQEPQT